MNKGGKPSSLLFMDLRVLENDGGAQIAISWQVRLSSQRPVLSLAFSCVSVKE